MADYKTIKGTKIQNYTTDPDNPLTGQVWYNETDQVLKVSTGPLVSAWATGNNLNTGRDSLGGAGTQTAALGFGGDAPPLGPGGGEFVVLTESYNGTNWTEVNDLNTAKLNLAGAGTQTAALAFGGSNPNPTPPPVLVVTGQTESWNGSAWTEVNDLNTARFDLAGCGATNTAALAFGGAPAPLGNTESWNGTSWTEVNDLNTARERFAGAGTQTAALGIGGGPPAVAVTESWNGTSWTEVNDLNTARFDLAGAGTQTAALAFGGREPGPFLAVTESWNGTSWTEVNDLNAVKHSLGGVGTNTAALAFGGQPGLATTEEWGETGGNKTITSS